MFKIIGGTPDKFAEIPKQQPVKHREVARHDRGRRAAGLRQRRLEHADRAAHLTCLGVRDREEERMQPRAAMLGRRLLQLLAQVDALLLVPPLDRCFFVARIRELRRRWRAESAAGAAGKRTAVE